MLNQPMSSPMIMMMLGFGCAAAGAAISATTANSATRTSNPLRLGLRTALSPRFSGALRPDDRLLDLRLTAMAAFGWAPRLASRSSPRRGRPPAPLAFDTAVQLAGPRRPSRYSETNAARHGSESKPDAPRPVLHRGAPSSLQVLVRAVRLRRM